MTQQLDKYRQNFLATFLLIKRNKYIRAVSQNVLGIAVLIGLGIIAFIPYQVSPGGKIELKSSQQQRVQAPISGKIDKVFYQGGKNKLIPKGTVIAVMEVPDIQKERQKLQQQIEEEKATLRREKEELMRLENTPRPEEVEVAKARIGVALEDLNQAKQRLKMAESQVRFSSAEVSRFKKLWEEGAVSQQRFENRQKEAEVDLENVDVSRLEIVKKQRELDSSEADLKLVLSGFHPQSIQAQREEISSVEAKIKVLQEELSYQTDQIDRATLPMPFEGRLITADLQRKVGTYLQKGDTFAMVEVLESDTLKARMQVPEVAIEQISPDAQVEIRLLAYPNQPVFGRVVSIQPRAKNKETIERKSPITGDTSVETRDEGTRFVDVIVEVPNENNLLLPGMSGHAKVQGETMPVFLAFSRSIIRFIKIEIWSWLP